MASKRITDCKRSEFRAHTMQVDRGKKDLEIKFRSDAKHEVIVESNRVRDKGPSQSASASSKVKCIASYYYCAQDHIIIAF